MDVSDDQRRVIEAVVSAVAVPQPLGTVEKMPCEVTACITVWNGLCTLGHTLFSLEKGAQSVPLRLILAENGSDDGTQLVLRDMAKDSVTRAHWLRRGFRDIGVVEEPQHEEFPGRFPREYVNIKACFEKMFALVETPYLLTVDADVEVPRGSLRTMLELLKGDDTLGMVGIIYEFETTHVKHGLAMMRTELAKKVRLRADACMCSQLDRQIRDMGFSVKHLSPLSARHVKLEQ